MSRCRQALKKTCTAGLRFPDRRHIACDQSGLADSPCVLSPRASFPRRPAVVLSLVGRIANPSHKMPKRNGEEHLDCSHRPVWTPSMNTPAPEPRHVSVLPAEVHDLLAPAPGQTI